MIYDIYMGKVIVVYFLFTISIFAKIEHRLNYQINPDVRGFNFILLIENTPSKLGDERPVLTSLIKKSKSIKININPNQIINEMFIEGYQIITISYLNPNEYYQPGLDQSHAYIRYDIRNESNELNSERSIYKHSFSHLDKFVAGVNTYRPLCIVILLPPKEIYSLSRQNQKPTNFMKLRDFALINLYHEIHRRRYIYPNKLIIFPSIESNVGTLINNQ